MQEWAWKMAMMDVNGLRALHRGLMDDLWKEIVPHGPDGEESAEHGPSGIESSKDENQAEDA